jgi:hypothetical protein
MSGSAANDALVIRSGTPLEENMKRSLLPLLVAPLIALSAGACKGDFKATTPPSEDDEESLVGATNYTEDEQSEEEALDEKFGKRKELGKKGEPKEKCKGKGSKRECKMVDPTPEISAALGARKMTEGFRWGMSVDDAMKALTLSIEKDYEKMQSETTDPVQQDKNRSWRQDAIGGLAQQHVIFEERAHHKWGVSAISGEFKDDENEEMIWVKGATLKKFYFFKDGELWRIAVAYSNQHWPGKDFKAQMDEKFTKWFGVSPEEKVQVDEKTQAPLMRYPEWKSVDGDIVRAYDMRAVNGVTMVVIVNGDEENRVGLRLPNPPKDESFDEDVDGVLGGSDICYDEAGNMVEDAEKCKEIRGY